MQELITFCDKFISSSTGEVNSFICLISIASSRTFKVVDLAVDLRANLLYRIKKYTSDFNLLSLMILDPRFAKDEQLLPSINHGLIRMKLAEWFEPHTASGLYFDFSLISQMASFQCKLLVK